MSAAAAAASSTAVTTASDDHALMALIGQLNNVDAAAPAPVNPETGVSVLEDALKSVPAASEGDDEEDDDIVVDRPSSSRKPPAAEEKAEEKGDDDAPRESEKKKPKKEVKPPASETEDDDVPAKRAKKAEPEPKKNKKAEPEPKKSKKAEPEPEKKAKKAEPEPEKKAKKAEPEAVKKPKKAESDDEDDARAKKKKKAAEPEVKKHKKPASPVQEDEEEEAKPKAAPKAAPKKPTKKAKVDSDDEEERAAAAAKLAADLKELHILRAAQAAEKASKKGKSKDAPVALSAVQTELARRLGTGKLPARESARKALLRTRENVLVDEIVGADPLTKSVGKDKYMGGDGGPDVAEDEEDEEEYEAESDEESEDVEEEEEEEKPAKESPKKKGKADEEGKKKKRRPSIDSEGVELEPEVTEPESSEAEEEDDDDDEDVIRVDQDDGEGDDDEEGQESDADPRNMDIMTLVDTEAALSKRQAKRKKPATKTRTPEELKLDALVEEKTAWKHPLPEPGIVRMGEEYPDHTTKNDCRRTAAYKDLTLKLAIKDGKPEWSFGIMAPDRKGVMSFTKLRVGKDWNNKLQNWAAVRESNNARRVKDQWLPWVGSDKFRSMVRESLEGKKKSRARASSVKPASLAVPPGPTQTHTLERSFAKVAEPEKKQKANGKREAASAPPPATAIAVPGKSVDMCVAVEGALVRITQGLIEKKDMLTQTRAHMQGWERQLAGLNEATLVAMLQGILCPGFQSDERMASLSRTVIIFMCCSHPRTAAMLRAAMNPVSDGVESLFQ